MNTSQKTVVIAGASSGIGKSCVARMSRLGWQVFATVRKQSDSDQLAREFGENVHPVLMDLEDEAVGGEDKSRAAALALARFSGARPSCRLRNRDMHYGRADALDGSGDSGGVRVEQSPIRRAMVSSGAEIASWRVRKLGGRPEKCKAIFSSHAG